MKIWLVLTLSIRCLIKSYPLERNDFDTSTSCTSSKTTRSIRDLSRHRLAKKW
jgi:hypothetical protein